MQFENHARRLRIEVVTRLARLYAGNRLTSDIHKTPFEMIPRTATPNRCCVHKDRAVVRYRVLAALGFRVEDETEEWKSLNDYASEALALEKPEGPVLTVLDTACESCIRTHFFVSNACRGCVARPCTTVCPKKAIKIADHKARIDEDTCINCGLCQKACPYHSIIRIPVPCEESCPVGAIKKNESGKERIDPELCIGCGNCVRNCPFGAVMERSQWLFAGKAIREKRHTTALVAPAAAAQFPGTFAQFKTALLRLGFTEIREVAQGADETAKLETAEWREAIQEGKPYLTSSCCPAFAKTLDVHLPAIGKNRSRTPSPMALTARRVKSEHPETLTVFIGPCIAKRMEAQNLPDVDLVLTFEEIGALLIASDIDVLNQPEAPAFTTEASREGRGFAASGGVAHAIHASLKPEDLFRPVCIDGFSKENYLRLKEISKNGLDGNYLEGMACEGGCIGGPGSINPLRAAKKKLTEQIK